MNATSITTDCYTPALSYNTLLAFGVANSTFGAIAAILSLILIVATTLPLLYPKRRKKYSTYNLYIAYLAIPDLAVNLFLLGTTLALTRWDETEPQEWPYQRLLPLVRRGQSLHDLNNAFYPMCAAANLYTNVFLSFEIYRLLQISSVGKRYYPPTIGKVSKQVVTSYGIGMIVFVVDFYYASSCDVLKIKRNLIIYKVCLLIVSVVLPLSIMLVVGAMIYWQGLIESTKCRFKGRLRVLTFFFLRIVFVDVVLWMASITAHMVNWISEDQRTRLIACHSSLLVFGISAMVNFGCVLTKPDTRKLIVDAMTFVYCTRRWKAECRRRGSDNDSMSSSDTFFKVSKRRDPYLQSTHSLFWRRLSATRRTYQRSQSIHKEAELAEEHCQVDDSNNNCVISVALIDAIDPWDESERTNAMDTFDESDRTNATNTTSPSLPMGQEAKSTDEQCCHVVNPDLNISAKSDDRMDTVHQSKFHLVGAMKASEPFDDDSSYEV